MTSDSEPIMIQPCPVKGFFRIPLKTLGLFLILAPAFLIAQSVSPGKPIQEKKLLERLKDLKIAILETSLEMASLAERFRSLQESDKAARAEFDRLAGELKAAECPDCDLDFKTLTWRPRPSASKPVKGEKSP